MTSNLVMYDDANVAQFYGMASQGDAYAGYVDGYVTFPWLLTHFPNKHLMSISIHGAAADCLDMENGAAAYSLAPSWYHAAKTRKLHTARPVLYSSAGEVSAVLGYMDRAGIPRDDYFIWSAHTGRGNHICGPAACGYPQADLTQWTFTAWQRSLDESQVPADVFGGVLQKFPTLVLGSAGTYVEILQEDLVAHGFTALKEDGDFGPVTLMDVKSFQGKIGLVKDGIVGPLTWAALAKK